MEFKGLGKQSAKMLWDKVKTTLFHKSVTDVKVSGRTLTITKGDGSTSTQTTQDTTYGVVSKSANGLTPKLPDETSTTKYLRQDGTWVAPPNDNTTYSDATQTNHGLMSADDKKKLDGVEAGANNYVHPTGSGYKHIPSGGEAGQILRWSADGTAEWGKDEDTTYDVFAEGKSGLVPAPTQAMGGFVLTKNGWEELGLEYSYIDDTPSISLIVGNVAIPVELLAATTSKPGLMSAPDKTKLDSLPTGSDLSATYAKKSDVVGVYRYKGSVVDASKLPTSGQVAGDVYSIEADSAFGPTGTNVAWTSDGKWDNLGGIFTVTELTQADIDEICV